MCWTHPFPVEESSGSWWFFPFEVVCNGLKTSTLSPGFVTCSTCFTVLGTVGGYFNTPPTPVLHTPSFLELKWLKSQVSSLSLVVLVHRGGSTHEQSWKPLWGRVMKGGELEEPLQADSGAWSCDSCPLFWMVEHQTHRSICSGFSVHAGRPERRASHRPARQLSLGRPGFSRSKQTMMLEDEELTYFLEPSQFLIRMESVVWVTFTQPADPRPVTEWLMVEVILGGGSWHWLCSSAYQGFRPVLSTAELQLCGGVYKAVDVTSLLRSASGFWWEKDWLQPGRDVNCRFIVWLFEGS